MKYRWTDLTKPQQQVLLDCAKGGMYQAGRQFHTCRNLRDMGLLSVFNWNTYDLTDEGRRLADIGKDYQPPESQKARIERLYSEAMNERNP